MMQAQRQSATNQILNAKSDANQQNHTAMLRNGGGGNPARQ